MKKDKEIISWSFYDFANQPFSTIIITFLYGTFFIDQIALDEKLGTFLWTLGISFTAIIASVFSPVFGAFADSGNYRKIFFMVFTWICVFFCCMLYFPVSGDVYMALIFFIIANISFEIATVFYNSYLPDISNRKNIGKISGFSWGLGFIGGLTSLFIALLIFPDLKSVVPDLNSTAIRKTNIFVGAWLFIFSIPAFISLKDKKKETIKKRHITNSFKSIQKTFQDIKKYRKIVRFLVARLFFNDALITIFALGGIYAKAALGFTIPEVIILGIVLNIAAAIGSFIFGYLEDFIGVKKVINISLLVLILATSVAYIAPYANQISDISISFFLIDFNYTITFPQFLFWISGILIGLMVGPNQSCSRSLMARLIPKEKQNEFFGFFAFTGKATSFLGPILFGIIVKIYNHQAALWVVIIFFSIGFILFNFPRINYTQEEK